MEQIDFVTIEEKKRPRKRAAAPKKVASASRQATARQGAVREGYRKMQALMEDRSVTELIVQAAESFLRNRD